jgi:hypothetical protein
MGYYVKIVKSTAKIPAQNLKLVYGIWCDLNKPENNHLKRGGSYSQGGKTNHWYSWLTENYDTECRSAQEILTELGFDYIIGFDGSISITGYDNKSGQEDLFFERVRHLLEGSITWEGEEGEQFTWNFNS